MRIRSIEMHGFLSHADTKLTFPRRGMILVSGPNGAGKSSILEAVSVGVWKAVLRGRGRLGARSINLWSSKKGYIEIATDQVTVRRRASGKLDWKDAAGNAIKFENNTKAQAALEELLGPQDQWAKRFIFSSESALFTAGTDADRTRLIESILGLDDFDTYAERVRLDLQRVLARTDALKRSELVLEERVRGARTALEELSVPDAPEAFGERVTPERVPALLARYRALLASPRRTAALKAEKLTRRRVLLEERIRAAERAVSAGVCPTCGQTMPTGDGRAEHAAASVDLLALRAKLARVTKHEKRAIKERTKEWEAHTRLERRQENVKRWARAHVEAAAQRKRALFALEDAEDELAAALGELETLASELAELRAAERVLGFGGVRSNLLSDALAGIESITNSWLRMFSSAGDYQLQVRLKTYAEKKSGGSRPAVHVGVEGVANGEGYLAASNGERRRVDAALLLALPEVSISGDDLGVLFFDELFDHLDDEGRDAVCEILREISKRCCVVLITHSRALRVRIAPTVDAEWRIEGGKVHVQ